MIGECAICGKETLLVEHHVSAKTRPAYLEWLEEQKEKKRDKGKARMEEAELELSVIRKMRMGVL